MLQYDFFFITDDDNFLKDNLMRLKWLGKDTAIGWAAKQARLIGLNLFTTAVAKLKWMLKSPKKDFTNSF